MKNVHWIMYEVIQSFGRNLGNANNAKSFSACAGLLVQTSVHTGYLQGFLFSIYTLLSSPRSVRMSVLQSPSERAPYD